MGRFILATSLVLAGHVLGLVALEGSFRLLPVSRGLVRAEDGGRWPLRNYRPHVPYDYSRRWTLSGVRHGRTNNYGHLAGFDFQPGRARVAVIGDSYVEARMNAYEETLQGELGHLLGDPEGVYGLGATGLSMADYLVLAGQAAGEFRPRAVAFVMTDLDLGEAVTPRPGYYHFPADGNEGPRYIPERDGERSWVNEALAESSLYRYLKSNLGIDFAQLAKQLTEPFRPSPLPASPAGRRKERRIRLAVDRFIRNLPAATGLPPACHVFLMDADRYALYDPAQARAPGDPPVLRRYFMDQARAAGFQVVDLGPRFAELYRQGRRHFDYYPEDRHWNWLGHGVAARAAYDALAGGEGACPGVRERPGAGASSFALLENTP